MSSLRLSAFLSALTAVLTVLPMRGILAATNDPSVPDLQLGWMAIGLLGGLALFLYGMDHLATALKTLAGARLRVILAKMTRNRFMAVLSGVAKCKNQVTEWSQKNTRRSPPPPHE